MAIAKTNPPKSNLKTSTLDIYMESMTTIRFLKSIQRTKQRLRYLTQNFQTPKKAMGWHITKHQDHFCSFTNKLFTAGTQQQGH